MQERKSGKILLESGTNEIEIMQFTINGNLYGINVAKVREIMMCAPVKQMPQSHPVVEGIFKPRDAVLTVVDLPYYLTGQPCNKDARDLFIITNFNKMFIAFRVHTVVGISRISWNDIQKPDKTVTGGGDGVATGIAQCDKQLVTILDFEKIVAEIAPETSIQMSEIDNLGVRERCEQPILIAEDSVLLAKLIREALMRAGYTNLKIFDDGQALWDFLEPMTEDETERKKNAALIITDIEMPRMDGHRLTKLVKSNQKLKDIPLVIFSSLVTDEMRIKGKELGADEQLSKPEIAHLVDVMDFLLERGRT